MTLQKKTCKKLCKINPAKKTCKKLCKKALQKKPCKKLCGKPTGSEAPLYRTKLAEKFREALGAVLPIMAIVLLLSFTFTPMPTSILLAFLFGGGLLVVGMMLFSLGAELAMAPMGERIGAKVTKSRKLWFILLLGFVLGVMVTVSEPDLQVLANQVPAIPNLILIVSVAAGVGLFLVVALLRMLFGVPLRILLIVFYAAVFVLALFAPKSFLAVAFDAGGVTTGPMTVPFIMAFGLGISAIRSDRRAFTDSFGLVALCSVGPILAVLALSLVYSPENAAYTPPVIPELGDSVDLAGLFLRSAPAYMKEIGIALLPIAVFFYAYQLISLRLERHVVRKITVGILYTYFGLIVFLTGVNVGFMPAGTFLGGALAGLQANWVIVPLGMLIGYFIVQAEPAVYVLMRQVEELTDGDVKGASLRRAFSFGVAASVGLAMVRVLTGIPILWFLAPGYLAALALSFFVPDIFTAIAFDSGGVASGPMTATFLLPFAVGASVALGGNIVTDAFGVVAMVAMTPLIAIQCLGLRYRFKSKRAPMAEPGGGTAAVYGEYEVIEL